MLPYFGDAGVIGLAEGLKGITSLQDLDLVRCFALIVIVTSTLGASYRCL